MSNKPTPGDNKPADKEPSNKANKSDSIIENADKKPTDSKPAASAAKPGNKDASVDKSTKNAPVAVKPAARSNNNQPSSSGSSVAVVAALISTITAGGAFFLWKELTTVQHTVANTIGIEQSDLDKLKLSLEQTITSSTGQTTTQLQNSVAETKGSLEKQIAESTSKAESQTTSVQNEAKESISSIETALVETNASLEQSRSEVENIITTTKGEIKEELTQAVTATNTEIASTKQELTEVKGSFGELRQEVTGSFGELRQEVSDRLKSAEQAQASLHATVQESQTELKNAISRNRTDWAVAEVEHILRLANEQIQLEQNTVKAITTLRTADQRLKSLTEPALVKVREALEQEIASLAKVDVLDIPGIASTLGQLSSDAQELKTIGSAADATPTEAKSAEEEVDTTAEIVADNSLQAIKGFATAAFEGFGSLVVIKKDDKAFAPVIPPSQAFFVRQNLQLKLETARIALLKQDNATFHDTINTAISWTEQYFNADAPTTQKFINDLTSLTSLNLTPALPDISGSLKALQEVQPDLL